MRKSVKDVGYVDLELLPGDHVCGSVQWTVGNMPISRGAWAGHHVRLH